AVSIAALYEAHIYLGGPTSDTLRYSDIYIENSMIPGSQAYFGDEVAGIGDFNGDGIDDFAVRSQTASGGSGWWGEVNFFAGWDDTPTDVPYEYERTLPSTYILNQNYPNPFNGTTIIEFELSQRSVVTLEIYNSLGYRVRTLLNELSLSPGKHRAVWNSLDENMTVAPSGVYICKMSTQFGTGYSKVALIK
ncbi:MAG: T9SS type A sorting domain-containing protein, partial [Candidatus Zixiibacteriota bacterium]